MTETIEEVLYCANHPGRETTLRCNRCEKLICSECAILTPTGYRCPECVRSQQKVFDTAEWFDYPIAVVVGGGLAYIGSLLAIRLGFFTLLLAPGMGVLIAEIIRRLIRRRRSRRLFLITTVAVVLGSLPNMLQVLLIALLGGFSGGGSLGLFSLLWQGYYTVVVASSVYARISGIQLGK
jgi:hypothetical protein